MYLCVLFCFREEDSHRMSRRRDSSSGERNVARNRKRDPSPPAKLERAADKTPKLPAKSKRNRSRSPSGDELLDRKGPRSASRSPKMKSVEMVEPEKHFDDVPLPPSKRPRSESTEELPLKKKEREGPVQVRTFIPDVVL